MAFFTFTRMNRLPQKVLRARPDYFHIAEDINPYMKINIGRVDHNKMMSQWHALGNLYDDLKKWGFIKEVHEMKGIEGFPDFVFCANPVFPFADNNENKGVILGNMAHASRKSEPAHYSSFFTRKGYKIHTLPEGVLFEGMGTLYHIQMAK
jgi:N-dimethylarginine dimethylaminohydrolase